MPTAAIHSYETILGDMYLVQCREKGYCTLQLADAGMGTFQCGE